MGSYKCGLITSTPQTNIKEKNCNDSTVLGRLGIITLCVYVCVWRGVGDLTQVIRGHNLQPSHPPRFTQSLPAIPCYIYTYLDEVDGCLLICYLFDYVQVYYFPKRYCQRTCNQRITLSAFYVPFLSGNEIQRGDISQRSFYRSYLKLQDTIDFTVIAIFF